MKVHANAPLGPKGRPIMVHLLEVARSLPGRGRGRAAGSLVGAAVGAASHQRVAGRGDRDAAAFAHDRRRGLGIRACLRRRRHPPGLRRSVEFPRFRGHLIAGPVWPAWRISVHAVDPAVFIGVPPRGRRSDACRRSARRGRRWGGSSPSPNRQRTKLAPAGARRSGPFRDSLDCRRTIGNQRKPRFAATSERPRQDSNLRPAD